MTRILKKPDAQLTADNKKLIQESPLVVEDIKRRLIRAKNVKERKLELIDDENTLRSKCRIMADAIMSADYPVVYTGAGMSTAANIPDYRGPNGIWTTLKSTGIRPESTDIASTCKFNIPNLNSFNISLCRPHLRAFDSLWNGQQRNNKTHCFPKL